MAMAALW